MKLDFIKKGKEIALDEKSKGKIKRMVQATLERNNLSGDKTEKLGYWDL